MPVETRVWCKVTHTASRRESSVRSDCPLHFYLDRYSDIRQSFDECRVVNYQASPLYLIPRIEREAATLERKTGYLRCLSKSSDSAMILPFDLHSPEQYLAAVIDTIHEVGGVNNVPMPFMTPLQKAGYRCIKRPWGNIDFVFDTDHLYELPGKRHSRKRTYINSLERRGITTRTLTQDDWFSCQAVESQWGEEHEGRTGRMGYCTEVIRNLDQLPDSMRVTPLGLYDDKTLVGVAIGALLTRNYWTCSFRYADNDYQGASLKLFRDMARQFDDIPYECDGDGGGVGSSLWEFKRRLLTDNVMPLQQAMFVVKR